MGPGRKGLFPNDAFESARRPHVHYRLRSPPCPASVSSPRRAGRPRWSSSRCSSACSPWRWPPCKPGTGAFLLNPDGVSYLDIADAYLRADWHNAVSTYWSPLYSGCLAGALVLRPPSVWEFAAVKLVNFAIFLGALAAFERLLRELTLQRPARANAAEESASLPRGVSLLIGYALFIGSSCVLTSVAYVSPDLLVSAFVYLLAAEALRVGRKGTTPARSLTFGLLLGLGCLAKAVLLPVGLVFLAASAFRTGSFRKAAVHVAAAAAVLLIVFGGFVAAMSAKAGRLTLGDVSRLNYLWIVNGVPDHGWLTDDPRLGAPTHPPLRLPCALPAYEYAGPAAATYPLWNDPPAWCDGLKWRFDARQQLAAVAASLLDYYYIFLSHLAPLTAALAALHVGAWLAGGGTLRARLAARLRGLASDYPILLPALAACGLYGLVVVEPRYLAGFVVLLGVALLRGVRFPAARRDEAGRWAWAVTVVLVAAPMLWMGVQQAGAAVQGAADVPGQVARALEHRGVHPGDRVAHIGSSFDCAWARAARVHIAAEVRTADAGAFWAADSERQDEVCEAFRQAGATAVVGNPSPGLGRGWEHIPGTDCAVRMLSRAAP